MFRKIISGILCMAMIFSMSACGGTEETASSDTESSKAMLGELKETTEANQSSEDDTKADDSQSDEILNFTEPVEGEKIAVFDIEGYGQIKIKLFPEQCPKGVENFETLINEGYYDGVTFHRVIKDFMIQGGDPTATGSGGESIWGKGFEQEINSGLRHFSGAVSYATAADKLNGSQFFIVTGLTDINDDYFTSMEQYGKKFPDNAKKLYSEKGGYPFLDGDYEVFGQVFEGLDICFKIAETATDVSDKPLEDVVISKAVMEEYKPE